MLIICFDILNDRADGTEDISVQVTKSGLFVLKHFLYYFQLKTISGINYSVPDI